MNNVDRFYTEEPAVFAKNYFGYLSELFGKIDTEQIAQFIKTLLAARESGNTVFFIGNGGSAATSSHFANDLAIGTLALEKPFRIISLTDNQAVITAIANDFGYQEIFSRQLKVLGSPGDVVVAISASGNSQNIIETFEYAKSAGIKSVAITAFDGGRIKPMADETVHFPTEAKEYGPAEDLHMILDHLVSNYLMRFIKKSL
jgi:D-sedoheptulose 7-phosphate isomerase